jgi:hypothetical protein
MPIRFEYVDDLTAKSTSSEPRPKEWNVGDDGVNVKELKWIHIFLSQTTRPSWHTPPPKNLGEKSHRKMKADQWRSSIEFDVGTVFPGSSGSVVE